MIIFVIIGIVCVCGEWFLTCKAIRNADLFSNSGGGPSDGEYNHYIGAKNFYDPGGFANGFPGLCAVFVTGMHLTG